MSVNGSRGSFWKSGDGGGDGGGGGGGGGGGSGLSDLVLYTGIF